MKTKKKIKIPWWLVPKEVRNSVFDATGGVVDPTKVKWTYIVDGNGKRHYGVAG